MSSHICDTTGFTFETAEDNAASKAKQLGFLHFDFAGVASPDLNAALRDIPPGGSVLLTGISADVAASRAHIIGRRLMRSFSLVFTGVGVVLTRKDTPNTADEVCMTRSRAPIEVEPSRAPSPAAGFAIERDAPPPCATSVEATLLSMRPGDAVTFIGQSRYLVFVNCREAAAITGRKYMVQDRDGHPRVWCVSR